MARIKIEDVVDHLSSEIIRALEYAVKRVAPDAEFDPHQLFSKFRHELGRKCSTWEYVPDDYVEK